MIQKYLELLGKQFLLPLNYILAFLIGATINTAVGIGLFEEWIPYFVPIIIQAFSKASVKFANRNNDLLLELPAHRPDPAFIMDYSGEIIASMGKTKLLFDRKKMNNLEDLFDEDGKEKILKICQENESLNDFVCEEYSASLKNWYNVMLTKSSNKNHILVWTKALPIKNESKSNLSTAGSFGAQLLDNIEDLEQKNDGFKRVAAFILEQKFEGVFIAEQDSNGDFRGSVFKKQFGTLITSEEITISKESNAPILRSHKEKTITHSEQKGEKDFAEKHLFDSKVKSFLGFEIKNYINYFEGGVSAIVFNKEGRINESDLELIENLINKVRALNHLIETNNRLRKSETTLEKKLLEILEKENQLKSLNQELNTFFYTTSHDLKTPVVNIQQLLYLINLEQQNQQKIELPGEYNRLINNELNKMNRILDMLTLVSSLNGESLIKQNFNLHAAIEEVLKELKEDIDEAEFNVEISLNVDNHISGIRQLLKMMIKELIFNALVFRDIKKKKSWAKLSLMEENERCIIRIEDNGVGMNKKVEENATKMFHRGSNLSKGAGLGLYSIKKVAEFLDGELTIKSIEKVGTEVCIEIPTINATSTPNSLENYLN